jgi:hypothetical protein
LSDDPSSNNTHGYFQHQLFIDMKKTKRDYYAKEILRLSGEVLNIPKDQTVYANRILRKIKKYGEIYKKISGIVTE